MDRISIAADALIDAETRNTVLKEFPNLSAPKSIEEAFLIQDAVLKKKGRRNRSLEGRSRIR